MNSDRMNTIANRKVILDIRVSMKRSDIDKLTLGEIKKIKSDVNNDIQKLKFNEISDSVKKSMVGYTNTVVSISANRYGSKL